MERGAWRPWVAVSRLVPVLLALLLILDPLGATAIVASAPEADRADEVDRRDRGDQEDRGGQGGRERESDDGGNRDSRQDAADRRDRDERAAREDAEDEEEASGTGNAGKQDACPDGDADRRNRDHEDANCDEPPPEKEPPAERGAGRDAASDRDRSPRSDGGAGDERSGRDRDGESEADGASDGEREAGDRSDREADRSEERRRSRSREDRTEGFPTVIKPFTPPPPASEPVARIDAGALRPARTGGGGGEGEPWAADGHFAGGVVRARPAVLPILGTDDDALYLTQRRGDTVDEPGAEFGYAIPVPANGTYRVRLYFAEIYWGAPGGPAGAPGRRVFTVAAEGKRELVDYDIYEDVGPMTAAIKQFEVEVDDGTLDLGFYGKRGQPTVAAIEVDRVRDSGR